MAKTNKSGTRIFYVPDLLYVYTDSYEMSPTQRISEVIPWTKQVGVGAPTQRISMRNSTDKASWGWGPNRENFRRNSTDKASWGWGEDRGQ